MIFNNKKVKSKNSPGFWTATLSYDKDAEVVDESTGIKYSSKISSNLNHPLSDESAWVISSAPGVISLWSPLKPYLTPISYVIGPDGGLYQAIESNINTMPVGKPLIWKRHHSFGGRNSLIKEFIKSDIDKTTFLFTLEHDLNTTDIIWALKDPNQLACYPDIKIVNKSTVTIDFSNIYTTMLGGTYNLLLCGNVDIDTTEPMADGGILSVNTLTGGPQRNVNIDLDSIMGQKTSSKYVMLTTGALSLLNGSITLNATNISKNDLDIATLKTNYHNITLEVTTNQTNIATNVSHINNHYKELEAQELIIQANVAGIKTNTSDITTNDTHIADNEKDITLNQTDIGNNTGKISTIKTASTTNTTHIGWSADPKDYTGLYSISTDNHNDIIIIQKGIIENTSAISTNKVNIATNVIHINNHYKELEAQELIIQANVAGIKTNTSDITTNDTHILNNEKDITSNQTDIGKNTGKISTASTNITTNTTHIGYNIDSAKYVGLYLITSTNTKNIIGIQSGISTNTSNITINTTDIGTNVTHINNHYKELEAQEVIIQTNKTNIANNVLDIAANSTSLKDVIKASPSLTVGIIPKASENGYIEDGYQVGLLDGDLVVLGSDNMFNDTVIPQRYRAKAQIFKVAANWYNLWTVSPKVYAHDIAIVDAAGEMDYYMCYVGYDPTVTKLTPTTFLNYWQAYTMSIGIVTVNGVTGHTITLFTGDINEGKGIGPDVNLWFTDDRVTNSVSVVANTALSKSNKARLDIDEPKLTSVIAVANNNKTSIGKNTANISGQIAKVTANTKGVATNVAGIASNKLLIKDNANSIETNSSHISDNEKDITATNLVVASNTAKGKSNYTLVQTNVTHIGYNVEAAKYTGLYLITSTNAASIATVTAIANNNKTLVGKNTTNIAGNLIKINSNTGEVIKNTAGVASNKLNVTKAQTDIVTNTAHIADSEKDITASNIVIAANTAKGKNNATAISTNTTHIGYNVEASKYTGLYLKTDINAKAISSATATANNNKTIIGKNTTNIAGNKKLIEENTASLLLKADTSYVNDTFITKASEQADVTKNAQVQANKSGVASNKAGIAGKSGSVKTTSPIINAGTATAPIIGIVSPAAIDITGNAATATKLQTARTISLSGGITGSASFTGDTPCAIVNSGGKPGPKGETGPRGYPGGKGQAGTRGGQGMSGTPGADGDRGETGPRGSQGSRGYQGGSADCASETVVPPGAVDKAVAATGNAATATKLKVAQKISLSGVNGSALFDGETPCNIITTGGPTGPDGDQGEPGAKGGDGARGPTGYTGYKGSAGMSGYRGLEGAPGATGGQGQAGPTAYCEAYLPELTDDERTEAELSSNLLITISGVVSGSTTFDGAVNVDIVVKGNGDGPQGATGDQGKHGARGDAGARGDRGETGPRGEKGPTGATGSRGRIGTKGSTGNQGQCIRTTLFIDPSIEFPFVLVMHVTKEPNSINRSIKAAKTGVVSACKCDSGE